MIRHQSPYQWGTVLLKYTTPSNSDLWRQCFSFFFIPSNQCESLVFDRWGGIFIDTYLGYIFCGKGGGDQNSNSGIGYFFFYSIKKNLFKFLKTLLSFLFFICFCPLWGPKYQCIAMYCAVTAHLLQSSIRVQKWQTGSPPPETTVTIGGY